MPAYHFTTVRLDGSRSETLGLTELKNDEEAVSFGKKIIRDLMNGDETEYAGWTMSVTEGERIARSIPFSAVAPKK